MVCPKVVYKFKEHNENMEDALFPPFLGTNKPEFFKYLEEKYFEKHTNLFPVTGKSTYLFILISYLVKRVLKSIICKSFLRKNNCGS